MERKFLWLQYHVMNSEGKMFFNTGRRYNRSGSFSLGKCSLWRCKAFLAIYELFPFFAKLWLKTIMFSDDANSVPDKTNVQYLFDIIK